MAKAIATAVNTPEGEVLEGWLPIAGWVPTGGRVIAMRYHDGLDTLEVAGSNSPYYFTELNLTGNPENPWRMDADWINVLQGVSPYTIVFQI